MDIKKKKRLMTAGIILCAAVFVFSGVILAREYIDQKRRAEAFERVASLVETDGENGSAANDSEQDANKAAAYNKYSKVYAQNNDFIGWITVPDTRINYPVMQSKNNPNFYLYHDFEKAYSKFGVPFMQENCDVATSDNLIMYGHHMYNGSMFTRTFTVIISTFALTPWRASVNTRSLPPSRRWLTPMMGLDTIALSEPSERKILTNTLPSARSCRSMIRA